MNSNFFKNEITTVQHNLLSNLSGQVTTRQHIGVEGYLATPFYSLFKGHEQAFKYIQGVYFQRIKYTELEYLKIIRNSQFLPQFSQEQYKNLNKK